MWPLLCSIQSIQLNSIFLTKAEFLAKKKTTIFCIFYHKLPHLHIATKRFEMLSRNSLKAYNCRMANQEPNVGRFFVAFCVDKYLMEGLKSSGVHTTHCTW